MDDESRERWAEMSACDEDTNHKGSSDETTDEGNLLSTLKTRYMSCLKVMKWNLNTGT